MKFPKNSKIILLIVIFITGLLYQLPYMNFQYPLTQGDHGRDLYIFEQACKGALPYQDFFSQNGPLMPYYYCFFYKFLGSSIHSTLIAYNILVILTGAVVFLICSLVMSPAVSFLCAGWYYAFRGSEFFYTFNHIGALFCALLSMYFLLKTLIQKKPLLDIAYLFAFFLILIRSHLGLGVLGLIFGLNMFFQRKDSCFKKIILPNLFRFFLAAGSAFLIYWFLTRHLPASVKDKQIAFWSHETFQVNIFLVIESLFRNMFKIALSSVFMVIVIAFFILCLLRIIVRNDQKDSGRNEKIFIATCLIFSAVLLSEFLLSAVAWRLNWIFTLVIIILFFVTNKGSKGLNRYLRVGVFILIACQLVYQLIHTHVLINSFKNRENLLALDKAGVYISPKQKQWKETVTEVVTFITRDENKVKKMFAIPYMPIYYYLTDRSCPSRHWSIYEGFLNWDKHTMAHLNLDQVDHILVSNRAFYPINYLQEPQLGVFGRDYGRELFDYLQNNFEEIKTIGPFNTPAGFFENHAVKIYRRRNK